MAALTDRLRARLRPAYRRVAGMLPPRLRRRYMYLVSVGAILHLDNPRAFTEKMNWRILHDRRPGIAERCDKMRMKEIAEATVTGVPLRIPRTLWHGTDVREVPAAVWEEPWVLKPNHGSGQVIISPDARGIDELAAATAPWLRSELSDSLGEWGYDQARREILVEEKLPGDEVPADYKVYCFDGVPQYVLVDIGRFGPGEQRGRSIFDTRWNRQDVRLGTADSVEVPRPERLEDMLEISRQLSAGWDFLRVDLYVIGDDIWFGELTPYSGGGTGHYHPRSFDFQVGSHWTLPHLAEGERA